MSADERAKGQYLHDLLDSDASSRTVSIGLASPLLALFSLMGAGLR